MNSAAYRAGHYSAGVEDSRACRSSLQAFPAFPINFNLPIYTEYIMSSFKTLRMYHQSDFSGRSGWLARYPGPRSGSPGSSYIILADVGSDETNLTTASLCSLPLDLFLLAQMIYWYLVHRVTSGNGRPRRPFL